ncbi:MAG: LptF/LptG family permease, partial [Endomicrobia bacterium]|nr:LptF/LptG family permease [Endomicrobiia bacterium]
MIKKLHIYIIKEFCGSFLFGLAVFSMLLILDQIFQLVNLFLSKGVAFFLVLKLFAFILPNIMSLAIPMSVLFGVLIAYGRLSEDNEITAMKANGMNYKTLAVPVIVFVCIISAFLLFFNHFWSPSMQKDFRNLYEEILLKRPLVTFSEKTITKLGDYQIYASEVNNRNNTLSGVNIYKFEKQKPKISVSTSTAAGVQTQSQPQKQQPNISSSTIAAAKPQPQKQQPDDMSLKQQKEQGSWRIAASSASVKVYSNGVRFTLYNGYWQRANPSDINNMIHMTFNSYNFFIDLGSAIKGNSSSMREMSSPEIRKT